MAQSNKFVPNPALCKAIRRNCDISDARDNGIYTICTLFLKFRNLYKWENNVEPWNEAEPPKLLDWISDKEESWQTMRDVSFLQIPVNNSLVDPFHIEPVNEHLAASGLVYGAGYGKSMKSVFFLAERMEERTVERCPVIILGRELSRELAAPLAMLQDGVIYIRKEPLRYFFWDQIMEIRPSGQKAVQYVLQNYGLINDNLQIDRALLIEKLDEIVDQELSAIIYHEVGESIDDSLDRDLFKKIVAAFPDSPIEMLVRALKDILADTNPLGMIGHILAEKKKTSLGFYVTFLGGLHKLLFPEIIEAFQLYLVNEDWGMIEQATKTCRQANQVRAEKLHAIGKAIGTSSPDQIKLRIQKELLTPLGL